MKIVSRIGVLCTGGVVLIVLLFNIVAYNQAFSMMNFLSKGVRTKPIESLTPLEKAQLLFTGITLPKPENNTQPDEYNLIASVHSVYSGDLLLEAWYIPAPAPKGTVLFFHGYAESKSNMLEEARALYGMGYSAFLVDLRGSGGSDGTYTTVGFLEGNDVAASFRYVQAMVGAQPIILYGRSMGAASILRAMATQEITPNGLILEAVFAEMLTTVQNRFRSMGVPAFPAAHALIFWAGIQHGFSGFTHNPVDYAHRVMVPTLVMHGADDPRATLDEGEQVYAAIAAQDKQFIRFEHVGHESYLSAQPERWRGKVQLFLEGLP